MPRVSREQAKTHRDAITFASAKLFRERGVNGVSVADLMGAAGLTHGGFYGHFDSKEALAATACAQTLRQSAARWRQRLEGGAGADALRALFDNYLSIEARDNPGDSCAAAALASDVARESPDSALREAYVTGVKDLIAALTAGQKSGSAAGDRREALLQLSTLVGAIGLARASAGDPLSEEILAAARAGLARPLMRIPAAKSRRPAKV